MLRRKPTAIAITSEDLATFEDSRLRKLSKENKNHNHNNNNFNFDPNDELKPLPGDKARIVRSREERIGLNRRT
ncbi:anaphase-promoting complex, subunit CDC26 [Aspergillus bertholletiae]|uniref:Anaphase-promoting complex, subunit CDC26 n=1 Tax=Aspergillus bertholletiae TaxID=1226010 RepID=A0A5N7B2E8_9EURO|nr:anaphase-promoting complex, subunit CDC26 [Aspergillus bertholletiae]